MTQFRYELLKKKSDALKVKFRHIAKQVIVKLVVVMVLLFRIISHLKSIKQIYELKKQMRDDAATAFFSLTQAC